MAKQKSSKSPHLSAFGKSWLSDSQALAELMCLRMAKKDSDSLQDKFYNIPKWRKLFLAQLNLANGLLKLYSYDAILSVLEKNVSVWSLGAKWLDADFKEAQQKLDQVVDQEVVNQPIDVSDTLTIPQVYQEKQSLKSKLKDL